jgi:DNA polymerase
MPHDCHIDIETFSRVSLTKVGTYRYAEDPSTEIMCIMYAFGDEPVNAWITDAAIPRDLQKQFLAWMDEYQPGGLVTFGYKVPSRIRQHADRGGRFWAHNAMFERTVLNGPAGHVIGFPKTLRERWFCTMAQAKECGLPSDLGQCAKALKCKHQKNEDGRPDMLRLSKPRKPSKYNPSIRWFPDTVPDKFFRLWRYCVDDVLTEREIHKNTPALTNNERAVYLLDQRINDRGWRVDLKAVEDVQYLIDEYKARIEDKMIKLCGLKPTQNIKLADWIREQGVDIPNLQAPRRKISRRKSGGRFACIPFTT